MARLTEEQVKRIDRTDPVRREFALGSRIRDAELSGSLWDLSQSPEFQTIAANGVNGAGGNGNKRYLVAAGTALGDTATDVVTSPFIGVTIGDAGNGGAAQNGQVLLPPAASMAFQYLLIRSDAAKTIDIVQSGGGAVGGQAIKLKTKGTAGDHCIVFSDGTGWSHIVGLAP